VSLRRTASREFCIAENNMILLHGFIKKTRKMPGADLDLALARKKELEK